MALKSIFFLNSFIIFFLNVLGIFFIRHLLLKNKILLDNLDKTQSVSKKKNVVLIGGIILITNSLLISNNFFSQVNIYLFVIFLLGLFSDLYNFLKAKIKFLLIFILSFIFLYLNNSYLIGTISIDLIDKNFLNLLFVKIIFTSFCLTLYISGNNMIDGINGNSIGHSILVLSMICFVVIDKHQLDFVELKSNIYLIYVFIILIIFNFFNKIFLGDNGSYLSGGYVALTTIFLVGFYDLNPFIASIFLFYPCFEVLSSIIFKKKSFKAGKTHLHHKLYDYFNFKKSYSVFVTIFGINFFFIFLAVLNYDNDQYLKLIQLFYFLSLISIYAIVQKKN